MPLAAANTHTVVVIAAFSLYTLVIVVIGLYAARFSRDSDEDFFLAGRSLGSWVAALSASASSESGWVTLGLVGQGFALGARAYWIIPGCLVGFLFNWYVIAGRMSDRARQLDALTLPDFLAFSFGERRPVLRSLAVLIILVSMLAYVASQMAAAGKAFEGAFDINYRLGVLIGAVVVLVYTVSGGFRAVCWTDFLQALLMVGALVLFPIYLLITHGGLVFLHTQLAEVGGTAAHEPVGYLLKFWPQLGGLALVGFLLGSNALGINFGYPGQPHVLVRFMALKDRREVRVAGLVSFVWGLCVYWGAVTVGLFARAMFESGETWAAALKTDQEMSLVISAMHLLPGVLSGLVLAAILAAICSTADSQLVVAASSAANDLYARIFDRSGRKAHPWVNRLTVLGLGLLAVAMVVDQRVNVYKYVLTYGWAMLGAAFGPQVLLLLLWRRASYAGCLAGMLTGFGVAILWPQFYDAGATGVEVYNLPLAFVVALVVNIFVSVMIPGRGQVVGAEPDKTAPNAS